MGWNIRFAVTSNRPIDLKMIEKGLKEADPRYEVVDQEDGVFPELGHVYLGSEEDDILGELYLLRRGDEYFDDEIGTMIDNAELHEDPTREPVLKVLAEAPVVINMRVLFMGREAEECWDLVAPLWNWLFTEYGGLLEDEDGPLCDANGPVHPLSELEAPEHSQPQSISFTQPSSESWWSALFHRWRRRT